MATVTMNEAKEQAKKNAADARGLVFVTDKGVTGTVLGTLSERKKPLAELTCREPGCNNTHVREISDWHQCDRCHTHKKSKSKGGGGGSVSATGEASLTKPMKVLPTDTDEVRQMKEEFNSNLEKIQMAEKEERAHKAAEEKAARDAKKAEEEAAKQAERAKQQAADVAAKLAKIRQVAAEKGIGISPKSEAFNAEASEQEEQEAEQPA